MDTVHDGRGSADAPSDFNVQAFLDSAGPGSPSQLASVELRSLGGALARRPEGAGARATLHGDYIMFAVGGAMSPDVKAEV